MARAELAPSVAGSSMLKAWRSSGISRATVRRRFVKRADKAANILAPVEEQCRWLRSIGFADVDCYFKIYELAVFAGRK